MSLGGGGQGAEGRGQILETKNQTRMTRSKKPTVQMEPNNIFPSDVNHRSKKEAVGKAKENCV